MTEVIKAEKIMRQKGTRYFIVSEVVQGSVYNVQGYTDISELVRAESSLEACSKTKLKPRYTDKHFEVLQEFSMFLSGIDVCMETGKKQYAIAVTTISPILSEDEYDEQ